MLFEYKILLKTMKIGWRINPSPTAKILHWSCDPVVLTVYVSKMLMYMA